MTTRTPKKHRHAVTYVSLTAVAASSVTAAIYIARSAHPLGLVLTIAPLAHELVIHFIARVGADVAEHKCKRIPVLASVLGDVSEALDDELDS